jgi:hypothetical protein
MVVKLEVTADALQRCLERVLPKIAESNAEVGAVSPSKVGPLA